MSRIAIVSRLRRQPRPGSLDVTLEDLIKVLQDCTADDDLVVEAVAEMMRQGRLRTPAQPEASLDRVVNG
ncbi:MAG: hypothetical protein LDL07_07875 [Desulfarculus sp.]|nr:hypothetical protein [Desulfarculus sp.]